MLTIGFLHLSLLSGFLLFPVSTPVAGLRDPDDGGGQLDNRLHCTDPSLERANTHRVYFCMLPSHARTYSLFKGTLYAL